MSFLSVEFGSKFLFIIAETSALLRRACYLAWLMAMLSLFFLLCLRNISGSDYLRITLAVVNSVLCLLNLNLGSFMKSFASLMGVMVDANLLWSRAGVSMSASFPS